MKHNQNYDRYQDTGSILKELEKYQQVAMMKSHNDSFTKHKVQTLLCNFKASNKSNGYAKNNFSNVNMSFFKNKEVNLTDSINVSNKSSKPKLNSQPSNKKTLNFPSLLKVTKSLNIKQMNNHIPVAIKSSEKRSNNRYSSDSFNSFNVTYINRVLRK